MPTPHQPAATALSHAALRAALLATVDLLKRRRAADIGEGYIDGYVGLNWLEWHGGGLRLTETGRNICRQLKDDGTANQPSAPLVAAGVVAAAVAATASGAGAGVPTPPMH